MTRWIIEKSQGFTNVGLYRISESVRAYAYLILSLQASARSNIIGNTMSTLTAQRAFLNNFEDIVNRKVNIQEDIKHYQDTLSCASSKVDYRVGENIYMLPSDMNLHIKTETVGYNNKILISDSKFNLGKNDNVNAKGTKISHKDSKIKSHKAVTTATHKDSNGVLVQKPTVAHKEEKIALILSLAGDLRYGTRFSEKALFFHPNCDFHHD